MRAWRPVHAQDRHVMLLVVGFLQVALFYIEDENGARAATDDAVLAIGADSELTSGRGYHQIVVFQSIQGRLSAHLNDLKSVITARSDKLGTVRAEFQAGNLLSVKPLDNLHLLLLVQGP